MTGTATGTLSVARALEGATAKLDSAGVETPRLDAEVLLGEALGVGRHQLVIVAGEPLEPAPLASFEALIERRASREPVAYILGRKPFRRIELAVDQRVLIPRPESELLVEVGLTLPEGVPVVDVGTGSGAVALALASERPDLEVLGADVSADALAVARANSKRLGLEVEFVQGDLLAGLEDRFYAVLANLPYVAEGFDVPPEISRYEPVEALFAGPDGLDVIRRLIGQLNGVAVVALEVGFDQAAPVDALLGKAGFTLVDRLPDLAGHERVIVGRR